MRSGRLTTMEQETHLYCKTIQNSSHVDQGELRNNNLEIMLPYTYYYVCKLGWLIIELNIVDKLVQPASSLVISTIDVFCIKQHNHNSKSIGQRQDKIRTDVYFSLHDEVDMESKMDLQSTYF